MSWLLHITHPDQSKSVYSLTPGSQVLVGREEGDIQLGLDESVSTKHVRLRVKKDEILFEDLSSTNGVFHRNQKKSMGVILPDDVLLVGQTVLKFERPRKS